MASKVRIGIIGCARILNAHCAGTNFCRKTGLAACLKLSRCVRAKKKTPIVSQAGRRPMASSPAC